MIQFKKGNLLESMAEALVNTVNTIGVMGKGIALQFKERFPQNYKLYKRASEKKELQIGNMFVTYSNEIEGSKWIINFPTKKHWLHPSKIEYIQKGLDDLKKVIIANNIKSIAIPPLGCGNGGLTWSNVKPLIEEKLNDLYDVDITVYEPSDIAFEKSIERSIKKEPELTAIRAMVLSLMKEYTLLGYTMTLLETQKLVYFLLRVGENLKLDYVKHEYGPYSPKLIHVLYDMEGYYLRGMKYKQVKKYDPIFLLNEKKEEIKRALASKASNEQMERLNNVIKIIEGFESPFGMELLSSVDYVMKYECKSFEDTKEVVSKIGDWNERKKKQFNEQSILIAHNQLLKFSQGLGYRL